MWHAWREDICVRDFCRKLNELEDQGIEGKGITFQCVLKGQNDRALDDLCGSGHG